MVDMATSINNCRSETRVRAVVPPGMTSCRRWRTECADYFDEIGNIQKSIHDRERKRNELEEKMLSYRQSEERLTKLKCVKMQRYYKELQEREKHAKMRNLELTENVEILASKLKEFSIDCSRLLQKRVECKNCITHLKKLAIRGTSGTDEMDKLSSRASQPSTQGSSRSNGIFRGQHTSRGLLLSSSQAELRPNQCSLSPRQSGLLMHRHDSKASSTAALSDDIPNSGDLIVDGRSSDSISQRAGEQQTREEPDLPYPKRAEESSLSVKTPQDIRPSKSGPTGSSHLDTSPGGSDDGRVSREDDSHSTPQDHTHHAVPSATVEMKAEIAARESSESLREEVLVDGESAVPSQTNRGSPEQVTKTDDSLVSLSRLSVDGLSHLIRSIEQRLGVSDVSVYRSCIISQEQLGEISRICAGRGSLSALDLHVCSAAVLQQLPVLSSSLSSGSLLPSDLVSAHGPSATAPEDIRSRLPAESLPLWDCCFSHILQLQRRQVLSREHIVQLFTPLLLPSNATFTQQAGEMLNRLLTSDSESDQSSCSLASLQDDHEELKPPQNSCHGHGNGNQSAEEDSADQSPVESIPIRETRAYQLLRRSVAQERSWSDVKEQDSELSEIKPSNTTEKPELRPSVTRTKARVLSAVQSKAFLGESDDSISEIEQALRPNSHASSHDFDDFYD